MRKTIETHSVGVSKETHSHCKRHHDKSMLQPCTSTWPARPKKKEEALSY